MAASTNWRLLLCISDILNISLELRMHQFDGRCNYTLFYIHYPFFCLNTYILRAGSSVAYNSHILDERYGLQRVRGTLSLDFAVGS